MIIFRFIISEISPEGNYYLSIYYQWYTLRVGPADRQRTQLFLVASAPLPFQSIMVL
jgi:hypothetical protein